MEIGEALAMAIPVLGVGNQGDSCIFMNHPLVTKFTTLSELTIQSPKNHTRCGGNSDAPGDRALVGHTWCCCCRDSGLFHSVPRRY